MFYEVIAQFAKAGAPSFYTPGYEGYLSEAKDYFNIRSRVATNPKEITELGIIDDKTIRIIFRSHDKLRLEQISRSLRVFSMYLIDETHPLNFSSLISGKRLFRMHASEFASDEALGAGSQTPQSAMTLNEELLQLRQQVKEQEKEIRRLKKENDFLEEASAFFAASRLRSAKTKE